MLEGTTRVSIMPKDSRSYHKVFIQDSIVRCVAERLAILGFMGFTMISCY
jgi:hypothetical protein